MKKGTVLLGVTAIAAISAGVYFLVIRPSIPASEKQFEKFRSAVKIAGWDLFDAVSDTQLSFALSQWKKNLTRKEADQMILSAENKKESLQLLKLIKQWNPKTK